MTPLKQRIFNLLKRAGPDGMDANELFWIVYGDYDGFPQRYQGARMAARGKKRQRAALKANIWQLNRQLVGRRIVGERWQGGWYRLLTIR